MLIFIRSFLKVEEPTKVLVYSQTSTGIRGHTKGERKPKTNRGDYKARPILHTFEYKQHFQGTVC